uniref:DUF1289 domain-containing protein n=1 Tax=Afifella pfennigii TaxID=209897 RepID=UPI00054DA00B
MSEITSPPAIPDASPRRPGSPCTGLCRIDPASGYCLGCARSGEEIAIWGQAPDHVLKRVMAELPARRAELGIVFERLDWDAAEIADFVRETLRPGTGAWVFGVHGALGEFMIDKDEELVRRGD